MKKRLRTNPDFRDETFDWDGFFKPKRERADWATLGHVSDRDADEVDAVDDMARKLKQLYRRAGSMGSPPETFAADQKLYARAVRLLQQAEDIRSGEADATMAERERLIEDLEAMFNELIDRLNYWAPPFAYFGPSEGHLGFWPDLDQIRDAVIDSDSDRRTGLIGPNEGVLKVFDLDHVPEAFTGDVFEVNDHGNLTYYICVLGDLTKVWSIV